MTENKYVTVKIPAELIKEVDSLVGKHGYRSRAEIVKEALRAATQAYRESED